MTSKKLYLFSGTFSGFVYRSIILAEDRNAAFNILITKFPTFMLSDEMDVFKEIDLNKYLEDDKDAVLTIFNDVDETISNIDELIDDVSIMEYEIQQAAMKINQRINKYNENNEEDCLDCTTMPANIKADVPDDKVIKL